MTDEIPRIARLVAENRSLRNAFHLLHRVADAPLLQARADGKDRVVSAPGRR